MSNKKPEGATENGRITNRANGLGMIQINVGFTSTMLDEIDARAARCGENRSSYIRRIIEADLRECGQK